MTKHEHEHDSNDLGRLPTRELQEQTAARPEEGLRGDVAGQLIDALPSATIESDTFVNLADAA